MHTKGNNGPMRKSVDFINETIRHSLRFAEVLAEKDPEGSFAKYRDRCERELLHYLTGTTMKPQRRKGR